MWTGERAAWCGPAPMIHISGLGLAASYNPATFPNPIRTTPLSLVGFRTGSLPFALSDDILAVNLSLRVQYHLSSLASTWSHIQDDYFSFRYPQLWGFGMPTSIFLTYPPSHCPVDVHSPPIPLLQHISFVSTWKIPVDC